MLKGSEENIFILRVKEEDDGRLTGNVQPLTGGVSFLFSGIGSTVLALDRLMDVLEEEKKEKLSVDTKTYDKVYEKWLEEEKEKDGFVPEVCSKDEFFDRQSTEVFMVDVRYRQHSSWQGEIQWNGQKKYFRSELEFMYLIQSAFQKRKSENQ